MSANQPENTRVDCIMRWRTIMQPNTKMSSGQATFDLKAAREALSRATERPNVTTDIYHLAALIYLPAALDEIERQAAQIEQQKPAVEFVERYTEADGSKGFREVCKLLKANEARFRQFLLDARILYRLGGRLMPFAQHLEAGRFTVITGMNGENAYTTAKFTSKGITWVAGEWAKHNLAMGV